MHTKTLIVIKYLAVAVICMGFILSVGCKRGSENAGDNIVLEPETEKSFVTLKLLPEEITLACGDKFTVAKAISGDIFFTGNNAAVFREKDNLRGAYKLRGGEGVLCGIMGDGTVRIIGEDAKRYEEALEWTDIYDVAFGKDFAVGLCTNGELVACGTNDKGCMDVEDIHNVVQISAGGDQFVAVNAKGKVITRGKIGFELEIMKWQNAVSAACVGNGIAALTSGGELLTYNIDADIGDMQNITELKCTENDIFALTEQGELLTTASYASKLKKLSGIKGFDVGKEHIAIATGDSIKCFGSNKNLQCDTSRWNMSLTDKGGYITGFAENTSRDDAIILLSEKFRKQVELYTARDEIYSGEFVGTGARVKSGDEYLGTVVIYGDVNGDGRISETDKTLVYDSTENNALLEGAYKKAARVGHYASDTQPISASEAELIERHIKGIEYIKQYVHDEYYESLNKWYNVNNDVVGYVKVDGTRIDYPILYGGKNYYYHTRTIYKEHSGVGSIYSIHGEYHKNNIVIGHNARGSGKMFHGLHDIENRGKDLLTYKNRVISLTIYREYSSWEVYALYETPPTEPVVTQVNNIRNLDGYTDTQLEEWINGQIARSQIKLDVQPSVDDTLLTLYTCGDKYYSDPKSQSRLYLFFRRVG